MAITGIRLTPEDGLSAARLHHRVSMTSKRAVKLVAILAAAAFGVTALLITPDDRPMVFGALAAAGMTAYLFSLMAFVRIVALPRIVRRQFREQASLHEPYDVSWTETSCGVRGVTVNSDTPWGHYLMWRENDQVLLLYLSSGLYQMLPKRQVPAEAVEAIKGRLREAGVFEGRRFFA